MLRAKARGEELPELPELPESDVPEPAVQAAAAATAATAPLVEATNEAADAADAAVTADLPAEAAVWLVVSLCLKCPWHCYFRITVDLASLRVPQSWGQQW